MKQFQFIKTLGALLFVLGVGCLVILPLQLGIGKDKHENTYEKAFDDDHRLNTDEFSLMKQVQLETGVRLGLPNIIDPRRVDLKLNGRTFRVPLNRLIYSVSNSPYIEGELWAGFTIEASLPDFASRRPDNLELFLKNPSRGGAAIDIQVRRLCGETNVEFFGNGKPCTPESRIQLLYDVYSGNNDGDLKPRNDFANLNYYEFEGIEFAGFKIASLWNQEKQNYIKGVKNTIYKGKDRNGITQFINCTYPNKINSPHCEHWFAWSDDFIVRIFFPLKFADQWQAIHQFAECYLALLEVTDEVSADSPLIHPPLTPAQQEICP
jgi:hypothetical protein